MATLCTLLSKNIDVVTASQIAILSGTIEFDRSGVSPISRKDLKEIKSKVIFSS